MVILFNQLFKTNRELFFWKLLQRMLHCWNNFIICIKFSAIELFLQCWKQSEITYFKIWTVKGMWHDFNFAFTKILMNRSSSVRAAIILMLWRFPYQFVILCPCVLSQFFINWNIMFTIHNRFWMHSMLIYYTFMKKKIIIIMILSADLVYQIFWRLKISVSVYFCRLDEGSK